MTGSRTSHLPLEKASQGPFCCDVALAGAAPQLAQQAPTATSFVANLSRYTLARFIDSPPIRDLSFTLDLLIT